VIGLGLRNLAHCPVELNLMPESTLKWQAFNQKKPYFIATVFSLVAVVAAMAFIFSQLAGVRNAALEDLKKEVNPQETRDAQFKTVLNNLKKTQKDVDQVVQWVGDRYYWADILSNLRTLLIRVETGAHTKFRTDAGVWVERLITAPEAAEGEPGAAAPEGAAPAAAPSRGFDNEAFRRRYGLDGLKSTPAPEAAPADQGGGGVPVAKKKGNPNEIDTLDVTFKAVTLASVSASANSELGYAMLNELRNDPMFVREETDFVGGLTADEAPGVFTFRMTVKLRKPLKL